MPFGIAAPLLAIVFFIYGAYVVDCETTKSCTLSWSYAVIVSVVAASLIGAAQSHENRQSLKKQHTINVIFESRFSKFFHHILSDFWSSLGNHGRASLQDIIDAEKHLRGEGEYKQQFDMVMSIRAIANYYEFLAAAIKSGDLDANLSKECIGTMLIHFYRRAETFILYRRGEIDERGDRKTVDRPELYKNLIWLYEAWAPSYPTEEVSQMAPGQLRLPLGSRA